MDSGSVRIGKHFRDELQNEKKTMLEAEFVMLGGAVYEAPELDVRTREWKYRIEGYDFDGTWLAIVFTFKDRRSAFLITVFSIEKRSR
jgi:hypothetical protein